MTELLLEARRLTAGYGGRAVIQDVNIGVGAGEMVALLGANGAGKTTTLLALSGELPALAGEVLLGGVVTTAPLHRRARAGLGYVPEERSVFKEMSAMDNLRCGGVEVTDALAIFPELEGRLTVRGGLLSGGEQQMLTLSRTICRSPTVVMIDELSLGLAPRLVDRLLTVIRDACATRGTGVLLVEQHVRKALEYADRVYVMRRGQVVMGCSATDARQRISEIETSYLTEAIGRSASDEVAPSG